MHLGENSGESDCLKFDIYMQAAELIRENDPRVNELNRKNTLLFNDVILSAHIMINHMLLLPIIGEHYHPYI